MSKLHFHSEGQIFRVFKSVNESCLNVIKNVASPASSGKLYSVYPVQTIFFLLDFYVSQIQLKSAKMPTVVVKSCGVKYYADILDSSPSPALIGTEPVGNSEDFNYKIMNEKRKC